jgi:hypothetical protein
MEQGKPGIWIGAAVALAVVIVAVSIPRRREPAPLTPSSPAPIERVAPGSASPPRSDPGQPAVTSPIPGPTADQPPATRPAGTPPSATPPAPLPAQLPPVASDITRENITIALDNVQFAIRDHRAALGGNPVGTNAEITSALFGDNLKQLSQPMPDGSRINGNGELCDPWGTPYFFHQQSAQKMEVRSAGPDLKLWTSDDIQM